MITTEQIKELRDKTGISVMQCKKALEEAEGDMDKALLILKKKSSEIAGKKAGRETYDGLVVVKTSGKKATAVILNCETDFVAKNQDFISLAEAIADQAVAEGADKAKAAAPDLINPIIQKIGENIQLNKIIEVEGENLGTYVHSGKSGVITSLSGGTPELAKDISMHIAAMKPEFISRDNVDNDMVEAVKDIFKKEVEESNKPAEIKEKMLQGKINDYFKEKTLLEQSFIKNPDTTIKNLLEQNKASIVSFVRFSVTD